MTVTITEPYVHPRPGDVCAACDSVYEWVEEIVDMVPKRTLRWRRQTAIVAMARALEEADS